MTLLVCALLQAVLGFCQLLGVGGGGWLMPRLYSAVYGNIAQPNHYANLLWLGLASLLYLWARSPRPVSWLVLPAAMLTMAASLSASRSVFLFMLALPVLAWIVGRAGDEVGRRLRAGALLVAVLSVLAQGLVSSGVLSGSKVVSAASRIDEGGSNGQRLFDWEVALKTALEHPFTGSGIGTFAWQTAEHAAKLPPTTFVRIGENAHNTPLHLAAELGLVPALVIVGLFVWWFIRQLRLPPTPERWWCLAIVSIIGLHSLVEYPLWYTYFIIPFFLAIGLADAQDEGLRTVSFSSRWLLLPVAVGVFMLGWTLRDYRVLEEGYAVIDDAQRDVRHVESLALQVDRRSMFAPHAGILRIRNWVETDRAQAATVAGLCDTAARAKPSLEVLERCVTAYAWSGRDADAQHYVDVICGAYPVIYHGDVRRRVASLAAEGHALLTCRL
ncbi:PglL family O-oligosaccharyltransferase [Uliginosibacterium sp. H1]|uniref:PglL family O-oligosaccharyltransferase n=1 Tax=Uliginosibacterium sp. H1 TaxID=3114757 RepID=UPI002E1957B5|nr:Wzy polymerase domain-containing protein [Uliginosibacterium sp. H1]